VRDDLMEAAKIFSSQMKFLFLITTCFLAATVSLRGELPPAPEGMKFIPVLDEDFNGAKLDTNRWLVADSPWQLSYQSPAAVRITNGSLRLVAFTEADPKTGKLLHHTASVRCSPPYRQVKGYFEARLRLHMPAGINSAFWLMPPTLGTHGNQPELWAKDGVEVDIIEYVPCLTNNYLPTLHWGDYGTNHNTIHTSANVRLEPGEWHTFALLWDDSGYTFFCDDRQVARFTPGDKSMKSDSRVPVSVAPADVLFTAPSDKWAGGPPPGGFGSGEKPTLCMDVDWVRVWKLDRVEPKTVGRNAAQTAKAAGRHPNQLVESGPLTVQ
jgi:beta-glucanase (GH16 family)